MKRYASWLILVALLLTASVMAAAKGNDQPKYKVVEVKHLTVADKVSVKDKYLNDSYDFLREDLAKTGIFGTVVEDGGAISDADAANAVVLECKIIKYSCPWACSFRAEVTLSNRVDHKIILQFTTHELDINGGWGGQHAEMTGRGLVWEIKHKLK
jgi:hypothetical protein